MRKLVSLAPCFQSAFEPGLDRSMLALPPLPSWVLSDILRLWAGVKQWHICKRCTGLVLTQPNLWARRWRARREP